VEKEVDRAGHHGCHDKRQGIVDSAVVSVVDLVREHLGHRGGGAFGGLWGVGAAVVV
jgi:hypothetical protein